MILDHNPPLNTRRERLQRIGQSILNCLALAGLCVLTFCAFAGVDYIDRRAGEIEAQQRADAEQEVRSLRARIADLESWDCAQVQPKYRGAVEYRWCRRERRER